MGVSSARRVLFAFAVGVMVPLTASRVAVAQAPPDFPPLAPFPAPEAPALAPTPRVRPPPGYAPWPAPNEIPPGYAVPGYPPGYYPYPAARPDPNILPPPLPRKRRDMALFVSGVLAVGVGMSAVLLGSYFVASAAGRIDIYCEMPSVPCAHKNDATRMTGGAFLMAGGALLGTAGVPMWLIGSQWVTLPKAEPKHAWMRPEVRLGPTGASVTLRF